MSRKELCVGEQEQQYAQQHIAIAGKEMQGTEWKIKIISQSCLDLT